jgi:hypothetical protein
VGGVGCQTPGAGGQPPARQPVDRRELFREQNRVATPGDTEYCRQQLDSLRARGCGRESNEGLDVVVREPTDDPE